MMLAGCGGDDDSATPASKSKHATVVIDDLKFVDRKITVPRGATVTFANHDNQAHTATADKSGAFNTGAIQPGTSKQVTFPRVGTFTYHCSFHPFMTGTVSVD